MTDEKRVDSGSRFIRAAQHTIYQAYMEPQAIAAWRPPSGMKCEIIKFEPHVGGKFRMAYTYSGDHPTAGKTSADADVFEGYFKELIPGQKIVEVVEFESDDPAIAGQMSITTILSPMDGGTEVTVMAENVPPGINPEDHRQGIESSLGNLAEFVEKEK